MRFSVFLYVLFYSTFAVAEADLTNSSDYFQLERFPGSYIVQYDKKDENYRLILGGLKKIKGVVTPEKERRVTGELTQITYRIPELNTPDEAFSVLENQLIKLGATNLFKCTGRDCGSSNQWANAIFRYSRLYGLEESQTFASYRINNKYFSLYAVKRGNKRVYLRVEVLVENVLGMEAQAEQGDGIPFTGKESEFKALVKYLTENPERTLWLVGQNFSGSTYRQQLDKSNDQIMALKNRLIEQEIDAERISLYSLGGFSSEQNTEVLIFIE
ncbi:DUF4892 domain-containing protein [Neptuniibacter marinus]|uniref:DUF4892 domain-containing protein n=1 Tax=Neptuniibacter marinus TaxID=1806670 RepID=UPI00082EBC09|nr:DUF4892 domain-containing protein [Neptuniibacter marinus]